MRAPSRVGLLITLVLLGTGHPLSSQSDRTIPRRPGQLEFPPTAIEIPAPESLIHRLSDGTPVIVVEDHSLPLVEITVALRAGSDREPENRPGLAQLTGALIRRAGTRLHDADAFDEAVDALGAEVNTRSSGDRAGASMSALRENLQASLELFFEMLRGPAFQQDRLDSANSNILSSFAARNDDPLQVMEREWGWLSHGQGSYRGRQLTDHDIRAISRDDLQGFHKQFWRPSEAVVAVSGDVRTAEILETLERKVEEWRQAVGSPTAQEAAREGPAAQEGGADPGLYLVSHPTPQAKISLGHGLRPIENWLAEDVLALIVANEILAGTTGLVSRINNRLRSQGWVYRVLSEVDEPGNGQSGIFRIFLDSSPGRALPSVEVCLEEIVRFRDRPVEERELAAVKQELLTALALRFDSAEEIAGYFADDLMIDRPHQYWTGYADRLGALTTRDVQAAARAHFQPDRLRILVVGGGDRALQGGSRYRQLARWLGNVQHLPERDPLTLEVSPDPVAPGAS